MEVDGVGVKHLNNGNSTLSSIQIENRPYEISRDKVLISYYINNTNNIYQLSVEYFIFFSHSLFFFNAHRFHSSIVFRYIFKFFRRCGNIFYQRSLLC